MDIDLVLLSRKLKTNVFDYVKIIDKINDLNITLKVHGVI